ncbi:hypothetical protein EZJ49_08420 [Bdellovibrio bacteriovorus]|uniref:hypothetical protein n=1 Tax=Bdellovibrio bacteriovorus TaxID=959 RepID=UPI0021CF5288|nr:hypothetical protein [Bdellovibrio bacteriovorus]UXR63099.1 hypothetical protein EZJ49_08420 [Bdellovibrio bacteriovorus]
MSSTKPELKKVAELISQNNDRGAANYITTTPDFLNVQVKNLSLRLSNKDESVKVPFNDFSALVVGVVRDNADFRDILTADYSYEVRGVANDTDERTRYINQNNYTPIETTYLDMTNKGILVKNSSQKLVRNFWDTEDTQANYKAGPVVALGTNPEAAGVFTTRTFAERNLSGGTNRRAVEFSLKQFLCVSMAEAADSSASDQYVGRDVERFPAGDHNKYLTSCKSCHSVMDGMRGAFAKMEYVNFTHGGATGTYSHMNGDFFVKQGILDDYNAYYKEFVTPTINNILPDLVTNQENSTWFKARVAYLVSRGQTQAAATTTTRNTLNTIRDPAVANALFAEYRSIAANQTVLATIKANYKAANYITEYTANCLNKLGTTAGTAQAREDNFLVCNLDGKKELSLIYDFYNKKLTAAKVADAEKTRLLNKLINKGRPANINLATPYLQATGKRIQFPRNNFDSTTGVAVKMNKGSYPYGFVVNSDNFVNNATLGSKSSFFGWRGPASAGGSGVKDFGRMLSDSRRFSQCMAKRVYESVCLKKLEATQYSTLVRLGDRFEAVGYNLKNLYTEVALDPVCGVVKGE